MPSSLQFKFRFLAGGQPKGFFAQPGSSDGVHLTLGESQVAIDQILRVEVRDDRAFLVFSPNTPWDGKLRAELQQGNVLALEISKLPAKDFERYLERICSRAWAAKSKAQLEAEGKAELYRDAECPECQSLVDLSGLSATDFVFCDYCDCVFRTPTREVLTAGSKYQICGDCDFFGRVRDYTEFYFYFLLVVYGWSMRRRHLCDSCAKSLFFTTLWKNSIFLLGVPSSIWVGIKAFTGQDPSLKDLSRANKFAQKGQPLQANPIYSGLPRGLSKHPGVLYNRALGHLVGNDGNGAIDALQESLEACANYAPSLGLLHRLSQAAK